MNIPENIEGSLIANIEKYLSSGDPEIIKLGQRMCHKLRISYFILYPLRQYQHINPPKIKYSLFRDKLYPQISYHQCIAFINLNIRRIKHVHKGNYT